MKINWINPAGITQGQSGPTSQRACVRLRCIEPALYLERKGHVVNAFNIFNVNDWVNDPSFYMSDVYVLGKAFVDLTVVVEKLKQLGKKVIVDVCDNIFEPPEDGLKEIYLSLLPLADSTVSASQNLADILCERVGASVAVIPDHVEGEKLVPIFEPDKGKIRLLWFGYSNGLDLLLASLPEIARLATDRVVELSIVTKWGKQDEKLFLDIQTPIEIHLVEWSMDNMARELARCDMVIIPGSLEPARATKTANRLITSLYAGKYVAAFPLPAYRDFSSFVSLDMDIAGAVSIALENPGFASRRIADGQAFIDQYYSPACISKMWESVITGDEVV